MSRSRQSWAQAVLVVPGARWCSCPRSHLGPGMRLGSLVAVVHAALGAELNPVDLQGLLRLRDAQRSAELCERLVAWRGHAPCSWPGVTCSGEDTGSVERRLTGVDLRYCGLTNLPADSMVGWDALEILELRGNSITQLPPTIGRLTALKRLMLEMNELKSLPAELFSLSANLTNLYLSHNRLTSLPPEISRLAALRDIWLRGNILGTLPDSFCDLTSLEDGPYLMDCGLTALPACFGRLQGVQYLQVADNLLDDLPDSLRRMPQLRYLELRNNQLKTLPAWLNASSSVMSINANDNQIASLPEDLRSLPRKLTNLQLAGNPLTKDLVASKNQSGLFELLATAPGLVTLSLNVQARAESTSPSSYLLTMPGEDSGRIKCVSRPDLGSESTSVTQAAALSSLQAHLQQAAAECPFTIETYTPAAGGT